MSKKLQKIKGFLEMVEDYGACAYIVLIFVGLPLYFSDGYRRIGTDKALFFRNVSEKLGMLLVPVAILILLLVGLEFFLQRKNKSISLKKKDKTEGNRWLDIFAGIYAAGVVLSYLLSAYREEAWLGAPGWYMGLFAQLVFVGVYFLISRLWKPRKWMLYLVLPVSGVVFLLGYLDRFRFPILKMAARSESFISTIGNINWFCGYAVCVFFIGVILFWADTVQKRWQKILLTAYVVIGFGTLLAQGSDSGVLTLVVVMLALFCFSVKEEDKMLKFWQIMVMFAGICAVSSLLDALQKGSISARSELLRLITSMGFVIFVTVLSVLGLIFVLHDKKKGKYRKKLFETLAKILVCGFIGMVLLTILLGVVNTAFPGSIGKLSQYPIFTFSRSWGSWRGVTLEAAVRCIAEQDLLHKVVGVGPDAMWCYLYKDSSEGLYGLLYEHFGNSVLTNSHCELLTVFANVGIVGLVAFVGMFLSGIIGFLKKGKDDAPVLACGFSLLAYMVNNTFSFQQTLNGATIFVIMGIGAAFYRNRR